MSEQSKADGLKVRTEVMGADFVQRAQQNTTALTEPLQDWINEHAWGSTWQRDGLPRNVRSLVTIAMLTALKSPTELKGHIRGALNNGCTPQEIQEVSCHIAVRQRLRKPSGQRQRCWTCLPLRTTESSAIDIQAATLCV